MPELTDKEKAKARRDARKAKAKEAASSTSESEETVEEVEGQNPEPDDNLKIEEDTHPDGCQCNDCPPDPVESVPSEEPVSDDDPSDEDVVLAIYNQAKELCQKFCETDYGKTKLLKIYERGMNLWVYQGSKQNFLFKVDRRFYKIRRISVLPYLRREIPEILEILEERK